MFLFSAGMMESHVLQHNSYHQRMYQLHSVSRMGSTSESSSDSGGNQNSPVYTVDTQSDLLYTAKNMAFKNTWAGDNKQVYCVFLSNSSGYSTYKHKFNLHLITLI